MSAKRIFYVENMPDIALFETALAEDPDIDLTCVTKDTPAEQVSAVLENAHGYQIRGNYLHVPEGFSGNRALIERCPNLLAISTGGAGYDTIDIADCTAAGVLAVNQAGLNAGAVAEHAFGLMLALTRRIVEADRHTRKGLKERYWLKGHDVSGKTVGIVGLGQIGRRLAAMCGGAFAMRVLACHPRLSAAQAREYGAELVDFDTLLAESDFVQVCCPLNDETRGLFGAEAFKRMKPTAYFITTARGYIHDEDALLAALEAGEIAGAGLDVWTQEPPPADQPLLARDDVIATPHLAGVTYECFENTMYGAASQWRQILAGERPPRLINPDVWPAFCARFERVMGRPVVAA